MLNRASLEVTRVVQAVTVLLALMIDFGEYDDEVETVATLVVVVVLELLKRKSTTPVVDPKLDDGTPLVPGP